MKTYYAYKGKKIRVGSMADKTVRFGKLIDRHEKISIISAAIVFWSAFYAVVLTTYPMY